MVPLVVSPYVGAPTYPLPQTMVVDSGLGRNGPALSVTTATGPVAAVPSVAVKASPTAYSGASVTSIPTLPVRESSQPSTVTMIVYAPQYS